MYCKHFRSGYLLFISTKHQPSHWCLVILISETIFIQRKCRLLLYLLDVVKRGKWIEPRTLGLSCQCFAIAMTTRQPSVLIILSGGTECLSHTPGSYLVCAIRTRSSVCVYLPHHQTSSVPACKQMSETTITIQKIATYTCACSCRLGKSSLYKSLELDHQLCLEIILHVYPALLHMHAACTHTHLSCPVGSVPLKAYIAP